MYKKFLIITLAFLSMFSAYSMNCVRCCGKLHSDAEISRIETAVVQGKIVKSFAHTIADRRKMLEENASTYKYASDCWAELMQGSCVGMPLAIVGSMGSKGICCCGPIFCKIASISMCGCCIATLLCSYYATRQKIKMYDHIDLLHEKPADEIMEETTPLMHTEPKI